MKSKKKMTGKKRTKKKSYKKRGGMSPNSLFNSVFLLIIGFIKEFNDNLRLFENSFFFIKGGASIKTHLDSHNNKLTNDIDIVLVPDDINDAVSIIDEFVSQLSVLFSDFNVSNCSRSNEQGLYRICFNNIHIIDITVYKPNQFYNNSSMMQYAAQESGYKNVDDYIKHISSIGIYQTGIEFEIKSTIKGISNMLGYLNQIPSWKYELHQLSNKQYKNQFEIQRMNSLAKQTSDAYVSNLNDKLERYQKKLSLLYNYVTSK